MNLQPMHNEYSDGCSDFAVTSPPTITRQPRRHEVTYDSRENIHLECEADPKGDPKPT